MSGLVRTYLAVALCGIACAAGVAPIAARALEPAVTATTTSVRISSEKLHLSGTVLPAQPGGAVKLKVLRSKAKGAPYKRVRSAEATINLEGGYATTVRRKRQGACQLIAEWAGDADSLPSSASTGFRC
jgi:hypothetical protein